MVAHPFYYNELTPPLATPSTAMNSSVLFECVKNDSSLNDSQVFKNILQVLGYSTAQEFNEAAIQKVIKACTTYQQFKA